MDYTKPQPVPASDISGETTGDHGRSSTTDLSRRRVLGGVALTGAALPILAACGGGPEPLPDNDDTGSDDGTAAETPEAAASEETETGEPGAGDQGRQGSTGQALAKTSEIPVNGGKVYPEQQVVVVQPEAGSFKAYSAVCTHQQCTVTAVQDGSIICPCHQTRFSVADGSVQSGPAPEPLPARAITVDGDTIILA
ncbi:Rieske (2Fe-2S) protein [Thermasporomyces composti]|mgnify:CR=1 FL=1|uniref:Cytochrome bc1 complex Rieske iron-sulfur subunit n=1 Tax=Thermasporomyces composti TaxID=696763 RepID=A0A3D9V9A6_THECX|nr:Rieske (2Fe-2S) protein [Thermasporomyces composti]REF37876.1 secreted protein [Thermasporomyces composti]